MSEREKKENLRSMEEFELKMKAKGIRPSKTWKAMKKSIGSITIHDPSILD